MTVSRVPFAFTGLSIALSLSESLALCSGLRQDWFYTVDLWVVSLEHSQVIIHSSFVETGTLDHNLRDLSKRVQTVYFKAQLMVLFKVNRKALFPWPVVGRFLRKCVDHGQEPRCSSPVLTVQLAFSTTQIHKGSMFAWDVDVVAIWHDAFHKRAVLLSVSVLQNKRNSMNAHNFMQYGCLIDLPCPAMCFKFFW